MSAEDVAGGAITSTERLRLRELVHDDAAFIMELVNDPAWLRYIGDRNVHSLEDARGYIDKIRNGGYAKYGFGLWAVDSLESGESLGLCGLIRRDVLEHPDLGFAFLERHRGKGYAREASAAVLELARERFGFTKLLAVTTPDNGASQKVLESQGFHFERRIDWPETGEVLSLFAKEFPDGVPRMSTAHWKTAVESQTLAALDMLENAMRACPPRIWDDPATPIARRFWYLAYHTLFWLDRYLSASPEAHTPPAPYTMGELDPDGVYPDRTYTPDELLKYLEYGRAKVRALFRAMDDASAAAPSVFRPELSTLEFQLYTLRHHAHHTAQLNLILRQGGESPPRWVGRHVAESFEPR